MKDMGMNEYMMLYARALRGDPCALRNLPIELWPTDQEIAEHQAQCEKNAADRPAKHAPARTKREKNPPRNVQKVPEADRQLKLGV